MSAQNPFENPSSDRDPIIGLLRQDEQRIAVDTDQLTGRVLDRIHSRNRGFRRMAVAATTLSLLAVIGLNPLLSNSDQSPTRVTDRIVEVPSLAVGDQQPIDSEETAAWLESSERLRRLQLQLAQLNQIEQEQQLALTREQFSRSIASRNHRPFSAIHWRLKHEPD